MSVLEYSLPGQTEGGRKAFLRGGHGGKGGYRMSLLKKVFPFVKFKTIQPLLCYLLSPLTK